MFEGTTEFDSSLVVVTTNGQVNEFLSFSFEKQ